MNRALLLLLALAMLTPALVGTVAGRKASHQEPLDPAPCRDEPMSHIREAPPPDDRVAIGDGAYHPVDPPPEFALGYASSQEQTFLRWYFSDDVPANTTYVVYRAPQGEPETRLATVAPVNDTKEAQAVLDGADPRWPDLSDTLVDLLSPAPFNAESFESVLSILDQQPGLAKLLTNRYYPLALVTGHGYVDTGDQDGTTYAYRVEMQRPDRDPLELGRVNVTTGQPTPLAQPQDLMCISLGPDASLRANELGAWRTDPDERRFHRLVLLRWDPLSGSDVGESGAWVSGYDVFRAPSPNRMPSELADLSLQHLNGELPVQPMPSSVPASGAFSAHQFIDFYYADKTPTPGDWVYTITARDLMSQVPVLPGQEERFADPVEATSHDIDPPAPPTDPRATPTDDNDALQLRWNHTSTGRPMLHKSPGAKDDGPRKGWRPYKGSRERVTFDVYRTTNTTAGPPTDGCREPTAVNESRCWVRVAEDLRRTVWTDTDARRDVVYWYRVVAVDEAGNPSPHAGPARGVLRDLTPPPAPSVGFRGDDHKGSVRNPLPANTLVIDAPPGDTDTTRYRVSCSFGGAETVLTETERTGGRTQVQLEQHYVPPVPTASGNCTARGVDAQGNVGPASANASIAGYGQRQALPQPIITYASDEPRGSPIQVPGPIGGGDLMAEGSAIVVGPDLGLPGTQGPAAYLAWTMPPLPTISGFELHRLDLDNGTSRTVTVGPHARAYTDEAVAYGHTYRYNVTAFTYDGERADSEPRQVDLLPSRPGNDLDRGVRHLGTIEWVPVSGSHDGILHNPGNETQNGTTRLHWVCHACEGPAQETPFAIFRSHRADGDYVQVTPVQPMPLDGKLGNLEQRQYTIADEPRDDPWYVVVAFDARTGEPTARSIPLQPTVLSPEPDTVDWTNAALDQGATVGPGSCHGDPVDTARPLLLSWGFELHVDQWQSTRPDSLAGSGTVELLTASGPRSFDVSFHDLRVAQGKVPNGVCQGTVTVPDFNPVDEGLARLPDHAGLPVTLYDLQIGPFFQGAVADVTVGLPDGLRLDQATNRTTDRLPLRAAHLSPDSTVEFQASLPPTDQDCQGASIDLLVDPLNTRFVPLGQVSFGTGGFAFDDGCMAYEDPYDLEPLRDDHALLEPRPMEELGLGDANDGLLRARYDATQPASLDQAGLNATLEATLGEPLSYMASAPLGFEVTIEDRVELTLSRTGIASGTVRDAEVRFWYHPRAEAAVPLTSPTQTLTFDTLEVLPGGALYSQGPAPHPVTWDRRHTLDPASWELLVGPVTTPGRPAETMTAPHPSKPLDVAPFGQTLPDPGLNLRTEQASLAWDCAGGLTLDAATDVYVRLGGVSGPVRAELPTEGSPIDLHGYDAVLSVWGRSFLDNKAADTELAGELSLPFPANVTLPMDPMTLAEDGCIGGASVGQDVVLDYWDLPTSLDGVEFRSNPAGVQHDGNKTLWTLGSYQVRHLTLPDGSPAPVHTEAAFRPDGAFASARPLYDRASYALDGFTYLLEGLRLSEVGEAAPWDPAATAETPPDQGKPGFWDARGFIDLSGLVVSPYFGPLTSASSAPPHVIVASSEPYVGFDRVPRAEKVWVDIEDVQLVWGFDLVYAQNLTGDAPGRFTAFDRYEFLPVGLLMDAIESPVRTAEHALVDVQGSVRDTLLQGRDQVNTTLDGIRDLKDGAFADAKTLVNATLTSVETDVEAEVQAAFANVRTELQAMDPNTVTEQDLAALQTVVRSTVGDLQVAADGVEQGVQGLRTAKETALDPLARDLADARAQLLTLEASARETRRSIATMEGELTRLVDILTTGAPIDLPTQVNGKDTLTAVQDALAAVHQVRLELDRALQELETMVRIVDAAAAQLQAAVDEIDAGIGSVALFGQLLVQGAQGTLQEVDDALGDADPATVDQAFIDQLIDAVDAGETSALQLTSTVFALVRTDVANTLEELNATATALIDGLDTQLQALLDRLLQHVMTTLDDIRHQVHQYVEELLQAARTVLEQTRILHLDAAPVIGPERLATYLGLTSGPGALLAIAGAQGRTSDPWSAVGGDAPSWAQDAGVPATYVEVLSKTWDELPDDGLATDQVSSAVNRWVRANPEDPLVNSDDIGGGTTGPLADYGADIDQLRGFVLVGSTTQGQWQFEKLSLRTQATLGPSDERIVHADSIGLNITRHADFHLLAHGIESSVMEDGLTIDTDLRINASEPRFEGGLTLYEFETSDGSIFVEEAGAALGIGETILYLGAEFDGTLSSGSADVTVGGAVLFGVIDPQSPVLQHHYPEVLAKIGQQLPPEATGAGGTVTGMYVRAHGDVPVHALLGIQAGCGLKVNLGARVGLWLFVPDTGGDLTFGGQIGGYAYGTVVCAISARGEFLLEYQHKDGYHELSGEAWIAGGIGDCDPSTWKDWSDRWWGDSWCGQAGAHFTLSYSTAPGADWRWTYTVASEL